MDTGERNYRRFLNGDDAGFTALVEEYRAGLQLFLYSFTGDLQFAEDITQDTFVRLAVKKPRFHGRCAFRTWLYRIGRNLAVDGLRRGAREIPSDFEAEAETLADVRLLEEDYVRSERQRAVRAAIMRLKPEHRQILWLRYFEELPVRECGAVMKRGENAANALLVRARRALAAQLEKEGFNDENK